MRVTRPNTSASSEVVPVARPSWKRGLWYWSSSEVVGGARARSLIFCAEPHLLLGGLLLSTKSSTTKSGPPKAEMKDMKGKARCKHHQARHSGSTIRQGTHAAQGEYKARTQHKVSSLQRQHYLYD